MKGEQYDKESYFRENGWNWKMRKSKSKKPKQKVFRYGPVELLCPSITVYRE